jgi:hypothetical protein
MEDKKTYSFQEAMYLMSRDRRVMKLVDSENILHRCISVAEGIQLQRTKWNNKDWMPIDYYHESEINGRWIVVN